ncbi:glycoside hydrolase family 20 protein [Streptomyces polyrhachis]|uniref:Glycoside hydrolase family 20 protein n=1 Tax=Streptomyces polyrhachis TaxID=1282885 RepID=A0ABW2GC56_9ACTN
MEAGPEPEIPGTGGTDGPGSPDSADRTDRADRTDSTDSTDSTGRVPHPAWARRLPRGRRTRWPLAAGLAGVLLATGALALAGGRTPQPPQTRAAPSGGAVARMAAGPAVEASAPRTIPAVRSYEKGAGRGWSPLPGTRVVAPKDGPLADEGRRLARELDVPLAHTAARDGDVALALDADVPGGREAYRIAVSAGGGARITGASDAGVFYGTRTLLQARRSGGGLPPGVIEDRPDRAQRGFALDLARKFFPREWIEARMYELAALKYNQLGLHLSDDQAFRIESTTHPEIVSDPHLTKADVRALVALGRELHIEVIPEIDSPGHLGAVIAAHPSLGLRDGAGRPVRGAVNVIDPAAGRLLDELLAEYAPLFPARNWNLGGDEYAPLMSADPEARFPQLAAAARERYGERGRIQDLATAWLNDRAAVLEERGKRIQQWNDGIYPGGVVRTPGDRQVEYWTGKEYGARPPQDYLAEGRNLVNLNDEFLYYVLGEPNDFAYPTGQRIYEQWTPAVLRGTTPVPASVAGPDRILGARLAVWCDLAGAQSTAQVAAGVRLPLAALAQKVWDPRRPVLTWAEFRALAGVVAPAR